jgi:hypothetical protein
MEVVGHAERVAAGPIQVTPPVPFEGASLQSSRIGFARASATSMPLVAWGMLFDVTTRAPARARIWSEWFLEAQRLEALKQAAVDEQLMLFVLHQIFRSGHRIEPPTSQPGGWG